MGAGGGEKDDEKQGTHDGLLESRAKGNIMSPFDSIRYHKIVLLSIATG